MRHVYKILAIGLLLGSGGVLLEHAGTASSPALIPMVSLESDGRASVRSVPRESYFRAVHAAVGSVHESVLPELSCSRTEGAWRLHTFIVGIGITAELGLGPVFSVSAGPKVRLVYTRAEEPIYPLQ